MFEGMEYIYEVYKEGSFSKAAANLFISQPSLSASVKRIEERLGYPVFDRSTKPLRLTEFGEKYVESMLAIRNIEKNFQEYVNDYGNLKTGNLRLGGTNLVSSLIAPRLLQVYQEKYPQVVTELLEGTTPALEEMLSDGTVDMVIDYSLPYHGIFETVKLADEHLILTVPAAFEINTQLTPYVIPPERLTDGELPEDIPPVPLSLFREVPFVLLTRKNDTQKHAARMFQDAGFEPKKVFEAAQQMTAYHVCCQGMGAAFVSSILLARVSGNPAIRCYRLDPQHSVRQLCLIWKPERYFTKAMESFRELALKEIGTI